MNGKHLSEILKHLSMKLMIQFKRKNFVQKLKIHLLMRVKMTSTQLRKRNKFLDAGIQDVSTSISIVHDLTEKHKFSKGVMVMKVTNIYKHEIVDTRA